MIIALDEEQCRVVASKAIKGGKYFCQGCGQHLCPKQGLVRRPHFAHLSGKACEYITNKTEWHYEWQERFGLENSEIVFSYKGYKHIADIQIGNKVIEFQHSRISERDVYERNSFYSYWGLKVVWIFDIRKDYEEQEIRCYEKRPGYNWLYEWYKPKRSVLEALEMDAGVFLQVTDNYLIKITWYPNGDNWVKLNKFAGNIMKKEYAIKRIKKSIDNNYKPKLIIPEDLLDEQIEMKNNGLIM